LNKAKNASGDVTIAAFLLIGIMTIAYSGESKNI
jgi:hypothetical protein